MILTSRLAAVFLSINLVLATPGLGTYQALAAARINTPGKTGSHRLKLIVKPPPLDSTRMQTGHTPTASTSWMIKVPPGLAPSAALAAPGENPVADDSEKTQETQETSLEGDGSDWDEFFDNVQTEVQALDSADDEVKRKAAVYLAELGPQKVIAALLPTKTATNPAPSPTAPAKNPIENPEDFREMMVRDLGYISNIFKTQYGAPAVWKEQHLGWNLDREIDKAIAAVKTGLLSLTRYWKILKRFINSPEDRHLSVRFMSDKSGSLAFMVRGARDEEDGRYHYFIRYINRQKLSEKSFPFEIGDELVEIGGKTAAEAVKEVQAEMSNSDEPADRRLAAQALTSRKGSSGLEVPDGPIDIRIKRKTYPKEHPGFKYELIWQENPGSPFEPKPSTAAGLKQQIMEFANMLSPVYSYFSSLGAENPNSLGDWRGTLPYLGAKIEGESQKTDPLHAYAYDLERKKIGYVRIPDFTPEDESKTAAFLATLIGLFETETDGLIINLEDNPGGSAFLAYNYASMLTEQPLETPLHRIAITPEVLQTAENLDKFGKLIDSKVISENDETAQTILGAKDLGGLPVTFQTLLFYVKWARSVLEQKAAGEHITGPLYLYALNQINPSPIVRYTKPVMFLINGTTLSAPEFLAAIAQNNKLAKIFGEASGGAFGFVKDILMPPNLLRIVSLTVTGSLGIKSDKSTAEDLGIRPDPGYEYSDTVGDLKYNYEGKIKKINAMMLKTINEAASATPAKPLS